MARKSIQTLGVNKYTGRCHQCGQRVPANGGILRRVGGHFEVEHLACHEAGKPMVYAIGVGGGDVQIVNANGRCIDAPCCGCCD